ncbi:glyoxalase [Actinophytocola sp. KF-1]
MTSIDTITLEVADVAAAERFYATAFGLAGDRLRLRASDAPSTGFRGFTLSLIVAQPGNVDALVDAALEAGATTLRAPKKSMWGYGGVVQAPDGTIWKAATPKKKDTGPATKEFEDIVLLLGVTDMSASKKFYVDHGLTVAKSFANAYVEFARGDGAVQLGLYKRRGLAKDAGVAPDGSGSHRIAIGGTSAPFTDPDGFAWETSSLAARS